MRVYQAHLHLNAIIDMANIAAIKATMNITDIAVINTLKDIRDMPV
jgi:hypothetical protein